MDSYLWTAIFDHLEHPERIALGKIYSSYHRQWAARHAQYLLSRAHYLSHHTVPSLTRALLSARIEISYDSSRCQNFIAEKTRQFFQEGEAFVLPNPEREKKVAELTRSLMQEQAQSLVPPVCPLLLFSDRDNLLVLDERQRLWLNGVLKLEEVTQSEAILTSGNKSMIHFLAQGRLSTYRYDDINHRSDFAPAPTQLANNFALQGNKIISLWSSQTYSLSDREGRAIEDRTVLHRLDNGQLTRYIELFLVQDKTGCHLLLLSPHGGVIARTQLPLTLPIRAVSGNAFREVLLEQLDGTLLCLDFKVNNQEIERTTLTTLPMTGRLLPGLIIHRDGLYYRLNYDTQIGRWCKKQIEYEVQLRSGPSFALQ